MTSQKELLEKLKHPSADELSAKYTFYQLYNNFIRCVPPEYLRPLTISESELKKVREHSDRLFSSLCSSLQEKLRQEIR